jgi:thymidylate kinase
MAKLGKLFVFEGPDDSGKTTLAQAFMSHLRTQGINCQYFSFPGNEPHTLGNLVYKLHHGELNDAVESVTPTALQTMHIAAHLDAVESRILPALKEGTTVVLDRYWWSTYVYGRVGDVNLNALDAMVELERTVWGKVKPAVVFFIQRWPLQSRPRSSTAELKDHDQLLAEYMKLAARTPSMNHVEIIDNNKTIDHALDQIVRTVTPEKPSIRNSIRNGSISNGPIAASPQFDQPKLPLTRELPVASVNIHKSVPHFGQAKPTQVFDTYWRFAAKRQEIFFRRVSGAPPPWTDDLVLLEYKFTNAYRASDRVSQHLIRQVIYEGDQSPQEVFFRILLFKFFNRIETWELLEQELGTISFADYSFERYDSILSRAMGVGTRIYSAAYIMPSGGASSTVSRKHQMHLRLLETMMRDDLPARLVDTSSMKQAFKLLRSYPTLGDFLAYQYVTDLNYSTLVDFSEEEFVVPGPGARDGIRKCFSQLGHWNETDVIKAMMEQQDTEFERLGLKFQSLWGRRLQLIDCQSLFCEVDKYARINHPDVAGITGRTRIKQKYRIKRDPISFWYPPKWGLNDRIANEVEDVSRF